MPEEVKAAIDESLAKLKNSNPWRAEKTPG